MNDKIHAVNCPSCGAPLQMPAEYQQYFKCQFCGTTIEDQTPPHEREVGALPRLSIYSSSSLSTIQIPKQELLESAKHAGRNLFFIILGISMVAALALILFFGVLKNTGNLNSITSQLNRLHVYSFGLSRLLPSDNGTQPDLVSITRNSDDTNRMVYLDFEGIPQLRWQSAPLGDGSDYSYNPVVPGVAAIFFSYKTTLVAFNRLDGVILWQAALSDEIMNICKDCMQVFGGHLVTLTTDGVLSGFDTRSGQQVWSHRLNETPRQLLNLGGRPALLETQDDLVGINIYDPADGSLVKRIVPECPNEIFTDSPQHLGIYDPLFVSSNGKTFYVLISDYDPGCLQSWDSVSLSRSWQTSVPSDILGSMQWNPYLFTDDALYLNTDHDLFRVSLQNGAYQDIFSDADHKLTPLAVQDGKLVVLAERTRGTTQYSLWGLDIPSKSKLWEFDPKAKDLYDGDSSVVYQEGMFTSALNGSRVILLEAFSEPASISFTVLNLSDGSQLSKKIIKVAEDSSYWIDVIAWASDRITLELGDHIRLIDYANGAEITTWP